MSVVVLEPGRKGSGPFVVVEEDLPVGPLGEQGSVEALHFAVLPGIAARSTAGKEHARHFDKKSDAQRWLDQVTASVVRGDYVNPRQAGSLSPPTPKPGNSPGLESTSTKRIVDNALRLHLLPVSGDEPIATVRPTAVQGFIKRTRGQGPLPGTTPGVFHVQTQVFAAAWMTA